MRRAVFGVLILGLMLPACGKKGGGGVVGLARMFAVNLQESGSSDGRRVLRYDLEPGHRERVELLYTMGVGGQSVRMRIRMSLEVTERLDGGDNRVRLRFDDAGSAGGFFDPNAAEVNQALGVLKGVEGTMVMDSRGGVKDVEMRAPPGFPPEMRQTLDEMERQMGQLSNPLPESPVGVGATWQLEQEFESGGVKMTQTVDYELVEFTENGARVRSRIRQSAEPQRVTGPDGSFQVDFLQANGRADLVIRLDRISPQGKTSLDSTLRGTAFTEGTIQPVDMQMSTTMDSRPLD